MEDAEREKKERVDGFFNSVDQLKSIFEPYKKVLDKDYFEVTLHEPEGGSGEFLIEITFVSGWGETYRINFKSHIKHEDLKWSIEYSKNMGIKDDECDTNYGEFTEKHIMQYLESINSIIQQKLTYL